MQKTIIRKDDLKNIIYEKKDGTQQTLNDNINEGLSLLFIMGLAIGLLLFIFMNIISPMNIQLIAKQLCLNQYMVLESYKWNIFDSSYSSIICRSHETLIDLIN
jgi:hypothetical protein